MATYRSCALRVASPLNRSLSSSTHRQKRSSATACSFRKIFQSDSFISRIIALTVVRSHPQFSPNDGIAESQNRTPSTISEQAAPTKLLFSAFGIPVGLARHLVIEQRRLCIRTLRQPPSDEMEKEERNANTAARPALRRANVD